MNILVYTGVVLALTQVLKSAFGIKSKFVPLVALFVGAVFYVLAYFTGVVSFGYEPIIEALVGILSAIGVYSGVKNTLQ